MHFILVSCYANKLTSASLLFPFAVNISCTFLSYLRVFSMPLRDRMCRSGFLPSTWQRKVPVNDVCAKATKPVSLPLRIHHLSDVIVTRTKCILVVT